MTLQGIRVEDLVEAGLYESEGQAVQEALRFFLQGRPELRLQVALHRYRTDEELTLARAAALAGVSLERMKELLDRHGISLRLGPASIKEAQDEWTTLESWANADSDWRHRPLQSGQRGTSGSGKPGA
jgi:predicted HTH domain antitoxin